MNATSIINLCSAHDRSLKPIIHKYHFKLFIALVKQLKTTVTSRQFYQSPNNKTNGANVESKSRTIVFVCGDLYITDYQNLACYRRIPSHDITIAQNNQRNE